MTILEDDERPRPGRRAARLLSYDDPLTREHAPRRFGNPAIVDRNVTLLHEPSRRT
jgi:hypothetical protein